MTPSQSTGRSSPVAELRQYQLDGIEFLQEQGHAFLADVVNCTHESCKTRTHTLPSLRKYASGSAISPHRKTPVSTNMFELFGRASAEMAIGKSRIIAQANSGSSVDEGLRNQRKRAGRSNSVPERSVRHLRSNSKPKLGSFRANVTRRPRPQIRRDTRHVVRSMQQGVGVARADGNQSQ